MKRQGLLVTIKELRKLVGELLKDGLELPDDRLLDRKFQVNIINRKGLSDTWELE